MKNNNPEKIDVPKFEPGERVTWKDMDGNYSDSTAIIATIEIDKYDGKWRYLYSFLDSNGDPYLAFVEEKTLEKFEEPKDMN